MAPSRPRVVMRLEYAPPEGCPDDQVVRASIGAQVRRWDPFAPNAPWRLAVRLMKRGAAYAGSAELRDVSGAVEWTRPLTPRARCSDLIEDLAVTLALQINPPSPPPPGTPFAEVPALPSATSQPADARSVPPSPSPAPPRSGSARVPG